MTETELFEYKAIKTEITDLNRRIQETQVSDAMQFGIVVKGSGKEFPYSAKKFHISGIDFEKREELIAVLLKQREVQRDKLIVKQVEIEKYISDIKDSNTRTIFRMYFIDGLKQLQIAMRTGYDQSVVSRKIHEHLKLHS